MRLPSCRSSRIRHPSSSIPNKMNPIKIEFPAQNQRTRIRHASISIDSRQQLRLTIIIQLIFKIRSVINSGRNSDTIFSMLRNSQQTRGLAKSGLDFYNITKVLVNQRFQLWFLELHHASLIMTIDIQQLSWRRIDYNTFWTMIILSSLALRLRNEIVHPIDCYGILVIIVTDNIEIRHWLTKISQVNRIFHISLILGRFIATMNDNVCSILRCVVKNLHIADISILLPIVESRNHLIWILEIFRHIPCQCVFIQYDSFKVLKISGCGPQGLIRFYRKSTHQCRRRRHIINLHIIRVESDTCTFASLNLYTVLRHNLIEL